MNSFSRYVTSTEKSSNGENEPEAKLSRKINDIVQGVLISYQKLGGINHLEGANLPSRKSVTRIVNELDSLIFPGFRDEENLDILNLQYTIGEKMTRVARNLTTEAEKSLRYMCRMLEDCDKQGDCRGEAEKKIMILLAKIPEIRKRVNLDVEAAFRGDPAARSHEEIILSYPGIEAIMIYRIAHELWLLGIPLIPRMMSEYVHGKTGIDIHPGAEIGESFFIDHGTGVVIGETTEIGNSVKLYQGVTLGALSIKKEDGDKKRHPTIEDDVTIYAGATILGGTTIVGRGSVIGGNVWLISSVPPFSRIYNQPGNYIYKPTNREFADFQI